MAFSPQASETLILLIKSDLTSQTCEAQWIIVLHLIFFLNSAFAGCDTQNRQITKDWKEQHICLCYGIKIEIPSLLLLLCPPTRGTSPSLAPVTFAWITAWLFPWKPIRGAAFFFFFLTPSQTCFRGSNKSYSLAKCLKCILSHERENPILRLQCEISDVFLLVRSAVLLIHTLCCWHKTNMVGFWILEEVRRYPRSDSSWYFVNFIFLIPAAKTLFEANSWFKVTKGNILKRKRNAVLDIPVIPNYIAALFEASKNSTKELFHPWPNIT